MCVCVCVCVCVPSLLSLSPTPLSHSSRSSQSTQLSSLCYTAAPRSFTTHGGVHMSVLLSQLVSLTSSLSVTTSLFYDRPHLCLFLPCCCWGAIAFSNSCLTHRLKGKCWNLLREPFFMVILATYSCETAFCNLFCTKDLFHGRQFFFGLGVAINWGWFKYITLIVDFISVIRLWHLIQFTSTSP